MHRPVASALLGAGVLCSIVGSWTSGFLLVAAGIALATAGLAVALLLRAREHGSYVRGAAAFAAEVDRLLPARGARRDLSRVSAAAVWGWTAWGALALACSIAFIGMGADPGGGGSWFGLAALVLWCGMLLAPLARIWGSWRRVAVGVQALVLAILAFAPGAWATELALAAPVAYAGWSLSSGRRRGTGRAARPSGPPASAAPRPAAR